ncbi:MAG: hypothetical protein DRR08_33080, partial [Candidatus Parabeggiatoa sp. nov. 2]
GDESGAGNVVAHRPLVMFSETFAKAIASRYSNDINCYLAPKGRVIKAWGIAPGFNGFFNP